MDKVTILLVYVDDIAIASNDDEYVKMIKQKLADNFAIKDLGNIKQILGIRVTENDQEISIDQEILIDDILNRYGMKECNSSDTPMEVEKKLVEDDEQALSNQYPYRAIIGSLNYLSTITRPDISHTVNKLARKMERPTMKDWVAAKRVLRYLKGSKGFKISYKKSKHSGLILFSDSDYAGSEDKKSTSGFIALMNGSPISWYSRKQQTVALSTMEAEYVGLASATQEGLYLVEVLKFIGHEASLKILVDNQSCLKFAKNDKGPRKYARHIAVKFYFVKDMIAKNILNLEYVESERNAADIFTKSLSKIKHKEGLRMIGINVQGGVLSEH